VQGGAAVSLCDVVNARGASWGEDDNIIASLGLAGGLARVPSSGGMPQPVTELKHETKEITHRWPQVLPGAREVLFTAHTVMGDWRPQ
jgi:hypothetical protein